MKNNIERLLRPGSPIRECMPDISMSQADVEILYKALTSGNLENGSKL